MDAGGAIDRRLPRPLNLGVDRYKRSPKPVAGKGNPAPDRSEAYLQAQVNDLWRTLPPALAPEGRARRAKNAFPEPRKICSTSSRRTHRCSNPGSARSFASCARSASTSTRNGRRR